MKSNYLFLIFFISSAVLFSQTPKCHVQQNNKSQVYDKLRNEHEKQFAEWVQNHKTSTTQASVNIIPVVVHVVWNTPVQNISNAQVISQINILNEDFRKLNADTINTPVGFKSLIGDSKIEFCLAKRDPFGNPTTGITNTQTTEFSFAPLLGDTNIYYTASGGRDAWDTAQYINIWVCNNGGGMATFPGVPRPFTGMQDGVIMDPAMFGNMGSATPPNDLGRLCDHEIGHYFYLLHIFNSSAGCMNDTVADTPPQGVPILGCPVLNAVITDSCSPSAPGVMYCNYMDYTDDACKNMFSKGQCTRMNWCLNTFRSSLLTSQGCLAPLGYDEFIEKNNITVSPNPSNGVFNFSLNLKEEKNIVIDILNVIGERIYSEDFGSKKNGSIRIELSSLKSGIYFANIKTGNNLVTKKLLIQ